MEGFWILGMVGSILMALVMGRETAILPAMLEGAERAIALAVQLAASYGVWMGVLAVAREAGVLRKLAAMMQPVIARLMPSAREKPALREEIASNFAANMLGMGNAATPAGLAAMRMMAADGRDVCISDDMCMFLIINTSSLELLPMTVISMRQAAGSAAPSAVILPALAASAVSTAVGIMLALWLRRGGWRCGR